MPEVQGSSNVQGGPWVPGSKESEGPFSQSLYLFIFFFEETGINTSSWKVTVFGQR